MQERGLKRLLELEFQIPYAIRAMIGEFASESPIHRMTRAVSVATAYCPDLYDLVCEWEGLTSLEPPRPRPHAVDFPITYYEFSFAA